MTDRSVVQIDEKSMMEVLHREHAFADMFVAYLLTRNIRLSRWRCIDELCGRRTAIKRRAGVAVN